MFENRQKHAIEHANEHANVSVFDDFNFRWFQLCGSRCFKSWSSNLKFAKKMFATYKFQLKNCKINEETTDIQMNKFMHIWMF